MQVEHKTEKGTIQFRLIPNDGNLFTTGITAKNPIQEGFDFIGLTSEITEEQAKMMVDRLWSGYRDYSVIDDGSVGNYKRLVCNNAIYSFKSLMQHLRVYEVNPLMYDPSRTVKSYLEAQSRTGKWIVLFKPKI